MVVLLCVAIKQWFERKHYTELLERRFTDRLVQLDQWSLIISDLACSKPPKTKVLDKEASLMKKISTNVKDVFVGLVDSPVEYSEIIDPTIDKDQTISTGFIPGTTLVTETSEFLLKHKNFWQLAAKIGSSRGVIQLLTYNGHVNLRRKRQARDFAKCLYIHLSKNGKIIITTDLLKKLLSHETYKDYNTNNINNPNSEFNMNPIMKSSSSSNLN